MSRVYMYYISGIPLKPVKSRKIDNKNIIAKKKERNNWQDEKPNRIKNMVDSNTNTSVITLSVN